MPLNRPSPLHLLWVDAVPPPGLAQALAESGWGPFQLTHCADLSAAAARLSEAPAFDAVLMSLPAEGAVQLSAWPALSQATQHSAVVICGGPDEHPDWSLDLLARGVQDVLPSSTPINALPRLLRQAIERHRLEREARKAYATDLGTGLPKRTQLLEHMHHLLALREREPAPMGLLVVRVEGLNKASDLLGKESANVLRRKLAVRLRAGVRASDVVASLGADVFGVLLASTEKPEDTERVAKKLQNALAKPFPLAGQDLTLSCSVGLSLYPSEAQDAETLLRQATAAAAGRPVQAAGTSAAARPGKSAANDD